MIFADAVQYDFVPLHEAHLMLQLFLWLTGKQSACPVLLFVPQPTNPTACAQFVCVCLSLSVCVVIHANGITMSSWERTRQDKQ